MIFQNIVFIASYFIRIYPLSITEFLFDPVFYILIWCYMHMIQNPPWSCCNILDLINYLCVTNSRRFYCGNLYLYSGIFCTQASWQIITAEFYIDNFPSSNCLQWPWSVSFESLIGQRQDHLHESRTSRLEFLLLGMRSDEQVIKWYKQFIPGQCDFE